MSKIKKGKEGITIKNGIINGRGLINGNGLVNGNGLINGKYVDVKRLVKKGYVNGNGIIVGGTKTLFGREIRKVKRAKDKSSYIKIAVTFVLILFLIIPAVLYYLPSFTGTQGIVIDGKFDDWVNKTSIIFQDNFVYLHLQGLYPEKDKACYVVLRDISHPIYASGKEDFAENLSAGDVVLEITGNMQPKKAKFWIYEGNNQWKGPIDLRAAFGGSSAEIAMPSVFSSMQIYGYGIEKSDMGERVIPPVASWSKSSLIAKLRWIAPKIILSQREKLFAVDFKAYGGDVYIKSLTFNIPNYSRAQFSLNSSVPGIYYPSNHTYVFEKNVVVHSRKNLTVDFYGEFKVINGETISLFLNSVGTKAPYTISPSRHGASYVGIPSYKPKIDGGFAEWKNLSSDFKNDVYILQNYSKEERFIKYAKNVDINKFGRIESHGSYFYINVTGKILEGTLIGMEEYSYRNESVNSNPVETQKPLKPGYDEFYIFVDEDFDSSTGYYIDGIGADYAIKIVGKLGEIKDAHILKYSNGNWVNIGSIEVACGVNGMEIYTKYNLTGRYIVYAQNWLNMWDLGIKNGKNEVIKDHVVLNEIYINEDGNVEWIELYNPSSQKIKLDGWRIVDSLGRTLYKFSSDDFINSDTYTVVRINTNTNGISSLSIYLYDSSHLIDFTTIPNPSEHTKNSYARVFNTSANAPENVWTWDSTPTPNYQNDVYSAEKDASKGDVVPEFSSFILILIANVIVLWGGKYAFVKKREKG